jgi:parallel beta-helix repeat protein
MQGLVLTIVVLFVGVGIIPQIGGNTVYQKRLKDENTTCINFGSRGYIQDLIDNAPSGSIITIPCGTYYENIVIDKPLTILGNNCVTIDGSGSGDVVYINANNVNISGFNITNGNIGIHLYECTGVHVDYCDLYDNAKGIQLNYNSLYNNISNCQIWNSGSYGIHFSHQTVQQNTFYQNTITVTSEIGIRFASHRTFVNEFGTSNTVNGCPIRVLGEKDNITVDGFNAVLSSPVRATDYGLINMYNCDNVTLTNCVTSNHQNEGMYVRGENINVAITGCTASGNDEGIHLYECTGVHVDDCDLYDNAKGIQLNYNSLYNNISNCQIWNSGSYGIHFSHQTATDNIITGCYIFNNTRGISLGADDNLIYNNYFNNSDNALDTANNIWNITKTPGVNIIGGAYLGGNYWHDYTGIDVDGDGLGDTDLPYNSNGDIYNGGDWRPLVNVPPYVPSDPDPENNSLDIAIDSVLTWSGGDPDPGNTVTYDVYFDTSSPPAQVVWNQTETTYDPPDNMDYDTTYYWQIKAWDNHGACTEGLIWVFTTEEPPLPDLNCDGSLSWEDVTPGSIVTGDFEVSNDGEPDSILNWEIESYPDWGDWTFDPESGTGLGQGESVTINVEVVAPDEENTEFEGEVKIVNSENSSDFCIIPVFLQTPCETEFLEQQWIQRLFQNQLLGRIFFPFF